MLRLLFCCNYCCCEVSEGIAGMSKQYARCELRAGKDRRQETEHFAESMAQETWLWFPHHFGQACQRSGHHQRVILALRHHCTLPSRQQQQTDLCEMHHTSAQGHNTEPVPCLMWERAERNGNNAS